MALAKMGSIVTQLSGKIGGQTFGHSPAGNYIKNTGSYIRSSSNKRANQLVLFSALSQAWSGLSSANKSAWTAASQNFPYNNRVGEEKFYSGYNLFIKFNGNLRSIDLSTIETAPTALTFDDPTDLEITNQISGVILSADDVDANSRYNVYVSRPTRQGRSSKGQNMYLVGTYTAAEVESGTNITGNIQAVFGGLQTFMQYNYRIKAIKTANGQALNSYGSGSFVYGVI